MKLRAVITEPSRSRQLSSNLIMISLHSGSLYSSVRKVSFGWVVGFGCGLFLFVGNSDLFFFFFFNVPDPYVGLDPAFTGFICLDLDLTFTSSLCQDLV